MTRTTDRSLPIALLRAREAVMGPIRGLLAKAGVTEQQWRVLRVLQESGPLDPTEIARAACLLGPSLSRILAVLEQKGYVSRKAHDEDRRRQSITLTKAGDGLIMAHMAESDRVFSDLEAEFGAERVETLLDLLNDLARLR